jgi:hypothetical protein
LIDVGKVISRTSLRVFAVDANFVVEDSVKTDVSEIGDLLDRAQVAAIALPQAQNGPP